MKEAILAVDCLPLAAKKKKQHKSANSASAHDGSTCKHTCHRRRLEAHCRVSDPAPEPLARRARQLQQRTPSSSEKFNPKTQQSLCEREQMKSVWGMNSSKT